MYLLYESYNDETRNMKEQRHNTKILGLYENKNRAVEELKEFVENTIIDENEKYIWFTKKFDKSLLENKNIIGAYQVFNEELENCMENYMIILEKVEVKNNE